MSGPSGESGTRACLCAYLRERGHRGPDVLLFSPHAVNVDDTPTPFMRGRIPMVAQERTHSLIGTHLGPPGGWAT
jgi:hypothetical protein